MREFRGISAISSMSRLYGRIIKKRIEEQIEDSEEQSGFRPGRSCVDIKQLAEKKTYLMDDNFLLYLYI